ncbi:hypothetical protein MRB53_036137 [Persea americana]|uniref:Uncharacterized protein n=1 Tax=Persea americana TaxID=3435 RepID=A0ACC2K6J8_PERAE|nr:hypothetical protein MRB53_036137 [Persea americana]
MEFLPKELIEACRKMIVSSKGDEKLEEKMNGHNSFFVSTCKASWKVCRVVDITAITRALRLIVHARSARRKGCCLAISSPSTHGGRGALPSEGGSPSDLLFLAGGGSFSESIVSLFVSSQEE